MFPGKLPLPKPVGQVTGELTGIFTQLVRFETELWNAVDSRLQTDHDLTLARFETIRVIATHASCRVYDIAEMLVITVGGASKIVDRVEALGHSRRTANPDDRRSSLIELTPAGARLLAVGAASVEDELHSRLGSAVPARALQQFSTTLTTLRSAASARASQAKAT